MRLCCLCIDTAPKRGSSRPQGQVCMGSHPDPGTCWMQAFMGDVAMWTGIVTGTLMCISPMLFKFWGWKLVAGATPAFLLVAGTPFFLGCILYAVLQPQAVTGTALLRCLVMFGALLQVGGSSTLPAARPLHAAIVCRYMVTMRGGWQAQG